MKQLKKEVTNNNSTYTMNYLSDDVITILVSSYCFNKDDKKEVIYMYVSIFYSGTTYNYQFNTYKSADSLKEYLVDNIKGEVSKVLDMHVSFWQL